jgi:hypothetical protein
MMLSQLNGCVSGVGVTAPELQPVRLIPNEYAVTAPERRLVRVSDFSNRCTRQRLIVDREPPRYAASVNYGTGSGIAFRNRITRSLMLVIGVLAIPSLRPMVMQGPHCAQHEGASIHQDMPQGSEHGMADRRTTSWDDGSTHDCPHCPASECAQIASCASSSGPAAVMTPFVVTHAAAHRAILPGVRHQLSSANHQPPTPPPQTDLPG